MNPDIKDTPEIWKVKWNLFKPRTIVLCDRWVRRSIEAKIHNSKETTLHQSLSIKAIGWNYCNRFHLIWNEEMFKECLWSRWRCKSEEYYKKRYALRDNAHDGGCRGEHERDGEGERNRVTAWQEIEIDWIHWTTFDILIAQVQNDKVKNQRWGNLTGFSKPVKPMWRLLELIKYFFQEKFIKPNKKVCVFRVT